MSPRDVEALLEFVEAVEEDCNGIWIEECNGEVSICLKGWANLPNIGEAYITACKSLGRPIMATVTGIDEVTDQAVIQELLGLPRIKF